MKKLLPNFAGVLFMLFALGVAAATMFYSFSGLNLIFSDDLAGQLFGLTLFDLAAFVWFLAFISKCESTMQYVFSGIGFLVGLIGTLGLVGIEIGLSSGMIESGTMAKPLTYIFVGVLIGHLVLLYAHHVSAPHIAAEISIGVEKAKITEKAEKDAVQLLMKNQNILAAPIARELVDRVLADLNLQPAQGQVLELPALEVTQEKQETSQGAAVGGIDFLSSLLSGWGKGARKFESNVASVEMNLEQQTPKPSPAADDAGREGIEEVKRKS